MSTLTIRLPDDKHERLKALAKSNSISINKLMDELATVALANYDARVRFETRAAAEDYARDKGLDYVVTEPHARKANIRPRGYGENFATDRKGAWTH